MKIILTPKIKQSFFNLCITIMLAPRCLTVLYLVCRLPKQPGEGTRNRTPFLSLFRSNSTLKCAYILIIRSVLKKSFILTKIFYYFQSTPNFVLDFALEFALEFAFFSRSSSVKNSSSFKILRSLDSIVPPPFV